MHIITPYNPWTPKKKKTWQEEMWEQQVIAEFEARVLTEASSKTLPENSPPTSLATAGPTVNAAAGGGGAPVVSYFNASTASTAGALNFSATVLSGVAPFSTIFSTSYPASLIGSYRWIFGDGTTSTDAMPTHTYHSSSTLYTASLQVTYSSGVSEVLAKNGYISASIPVLTSQFTYTTTSNIAPVTASFTNSSTYNGNGTLTYRWIFGDGTSSSLASPVAHPYVNSGSYTASLQVTESSYNITASYTQSFTKPAPTLLAGFTFTTSSNSAPSTATFLNTINGSGTQYNGNGSLLYHWELGSGSLTASSIIPTPTSYTVAGGYTASLAVTESSFGLMSVYTQSWALE